jgi:DNA mismatch repair ATPase MutS
LELADLLAEKYRIYHFCEQIEQNELSFDYLLKNGKLKQRNAIKLLELKNYPPEVVKEAYSRVEKILKSV